MKASFKGIKKVRTMFFALNNINRFIYFLALIILFLWCGVDVAAENQKFGNAEIVKSPVNVRKELPYFTLKTLITFKLRLGEVIDVLNPGTRVQILKKEILGGKYEWFQVEYRKNGAIRQGWIYSGEVNKRLYIRFDDQNRSHYLPAINHLKDRVGFELSNLVAFLNRHLMLPISEAQAQATSPGGIQKNATNDENAKDTNAVTTLLLGAAYIAIFILSLIACRKWVFPESAVLTFLTSLSLLLILGFVSQEIFGDLIARFLQWRG